jgi:hypothetical protein
MDIFTGRVASGPTQNLYALAQVDSEGYFEPRMYTDKHGQDNPGKKLYHGCTLMNTDKAIRERQLTTDEH